MNRGQKPASNSKEGKRSANEQLRKLEDSLTGYKGSCLFVINEDGDFCGQPVSNNCHIVSESAVLQGLRDHKAKKVLGLQWGVSQWRKLLFRVDPEQLVQDPRNFVPPEITTHDACVGRFACKPLAHDDEFRPIDVAHPDFRDSDVSFLSGYRISMYLADQYRQALELYEEWSQAALRNPNRRGRMSWRAVKEKLQRGQRVTEAAVSLLGKKWYGRKNGEKLPIATSSTEVMTFRSNLKFAGGVGYGNHAAITVFPARGHSHKMAVFNLKNESASVGRDFERLAGVARATEGCDNYGVSVIQELMTNGWGSLALSPESYRSLSDEERFAIQRVVARHSRNEEFIPTASQRPSMRKRRRK